VNVIKSILAGGLIASSLAFSFPHAQSQTDLPSLQRQTGAYVLDFERQLSGIVADEDYVQRGVPKPGSRRANLKRVELKSDLLMVKPVGGDRYIAFRDVYEANGRPVRDREDRLMKLFLSPTAATAGQAQAIADESARYNLAVQRNINVPTFALSVLDPEIQPRFRFKITKDRRPELTDKAAGLRDATVIEYSETAHPRLIEDDTGDDVKSEGRVWLDPAGRVVATEHVADRTNPRGDVDIRAVFDVAYRQESGIGPLVPGEMRELYELRNYDPKQASFATTVPIAA